MFEKTILDFSFFLFLILLFFFSVKMLKDFFLCLSSSVLRNIFITVCMLETFNFVNANRTYHKLMKIMLREIRFERDFC